jgi:hypothetical protein
VLRVTFHVFVSVGLPGPPPAEGDLERLAQEVPAATHNTTSCAAVISRAGNGI